VKRDVTKEVQLERQLSESQKMEALGTLAGGIAHDFNNILTPIMGYSELALEELSEEGLIHDWVEQVLVAAGRAKDIVGQILTFSRRSEETRETVELAPLVDEVLKLIRPTAPAIEIRQQISSEGHTVLGDPAQLHQLLVNLCTNATQAIGEEAGTLEVHVDSVCTRDDPASHPPQLDPGGYVRLTVRDSGCGMPREVVERIFEPFYTTKEVGKGTGLGLAVAHGVVKQLGGTITVESTPGKGTTFRVFLAAAEGQQTPDPEADDEVPTGRERILLVDDEAMVLAVIQATLEGLGYRVIAAASADAAIERFRSDPEGFDLVITDHKMPGMLGTDLTRAILAARSDTPIVLTTGFDHTIDPETVRDLGVRELIMKPMAAAELGRCVRRALGPDEVPTSSATPAGAQPETSKEWLAS
jgi:nitrogen-specific signal transduction histidine kinase/CheY-like chemotaxis protein